MVKVAWNKLTAGILTNNFNETIEDFTASDQALIFINSMKGINAYSKKVILWYLSMVRQFGVPTFLMPSSSFEMK